MEQFYFDNDDRKRRPKIKLTLHDEGTKATIVKIQAVTTLKRNDPGSTITIDFTHLGFKLTNFISSNIKLAASSPIYVEKHIYYQNYQVCIYSKKRSSFSIIEFRAQWVDSPNKLYDSHQIYSALEILGTKFIIAKKTADKFGFFPLLDHNNNILGTQIMYNSQDFV